VLAIVVVVVEASVYYCTYNFMAVELVRDIHTQHFLKNCCCRNLEKAMHDDEDINNTSTVVYIINTMQRQQPRPQKLGCRTLLWFIMVVNVVVRSF
jgi:hypothetical protein